MSISLEQGKQYLHVPKGMAALDFYSSMNKFSGLHAHQETFCYRIPRPSSPPILPVALLY